MRLKLIRKLWILLFLLRKENVQCQSILFGSSGHQFRDVAAEDYYNTSYEEAFDDDVDYYGDLYQAYYSYTPMDESYGNSKIRNLTEPFSKPFSKLY